MISYKKGGMLFVCCFYGRFLIINQDNAKYGDGDDDCYSYAKDVHFRRRLGNCGCAEGVGVAASTTKAVSACDGQ